MKLTQFMVLDDTTPMPFGKYSGTPMQDVPASYLHWLWTNGLSNNPDSPVAEYIRKNIDAMLAEREKRNAAKES